MEVREKGPLAYLTCNGWANTAQDDFPEINSLAGQPISIHSGLHLFPFIPQGCRARSMPYHGATDDGLIEICLASTQGECYPIRLI